MKRFLTSVSLQHEPKASDVITLVNKTFVARVSYEILYHEVWKCSFPRASRAEIRRSEIKLITCLRENPIQDLYSYVKEFERLEKKREHM